MEVKKIVEGMTAPQVAQVIDDNFKAQNAILEEDIAKQNNVIGVSEYKDFSEAEAVNVGDVRKYDGLLYECVEATTGAFDASKWKKSSFKNETEKKLSELGSYVSNEEYVRVYTDVDGKFLWGIRFDGSIEWAKGIPTPIKTEILNLYEKKIDKEEGKSLINSIFSQSIDFLDTDEYAEFKIDKDGKVVNAITKKGLNKFFRGYGTKDSSTFPQNIENLKILLTDNDNNLLAWVDSEGNIEWGKGVPTPIKNYIHNAINGIGDIPSYYFDNNYLPSKVDEINSAIRKCAANGDAFFWITDIHWNFCNNAKQSPALIKYMRKNSSITTLLNGGDNGDGYAPSIDLMQHLRDAVGSNKVYSAYGNHEFITNDDYNEVFYGVRAFLDDVSYNWSEKKDSFFVDNKANKMRYIALGSYGKQINGVLNNYESLYTHDTLQWFTDIALNVDEGWTIVVFAHTLYGLNGNNDGDGVLYPKWNPSLGEWEKHNGVIIEPIAGATNFIDAIDNYKNSGGKGDIACVLMGHTHTDRLHKGKTGVPYIISQCDSGRRILNDIKVSRTFNTINEQHFEVVVIDKKRRNIKLFAIGSPSTDGYDDDLGNETYLREIFY